VRAERDHAKRKIWEADQSLKGLERELKAAQKETEGLRRGHVKAVERARRSAVRLQGAISREAEDILKRKAITPPKPPKTHTHTQPPNTQTHAYTHLSLSNLLPSISSLPAHLELQILELEAGLKEKEAALMCAGTRERGGDPGIFRLLLRHAFLDLFLLVIFTEWPLLCAALPDALGPPRWIRKRGARQLRPPSRP